MRACVALLLACAKPFFALVLEAPCCSEKVHIPADFGAHHALQEHELLLASPLDLCAPLARELNATGKVLLARRGKCRFVTKALLAQRANASGLIVMDDVDRERWEVRMHSDEHDATTPAMTIPAVFVSHATGRELAAHVRAGYVAVSLNGTGEVDTITQYLERYDLSAEHVRLVHAALDFGQAMLPYMGYAYAISFAYVLLSSLYTLLLNWSAAVARRMFLHGPWRHLNVVSYSQHLDLMMLSGDAACCAICLDEFGPCHQIKPLPCTHIYHRSCIDKWFEKGSNACPLCKRPAFP
ncbi:hypothetical protein SPRG_10995 [Saprolegnia parasitica CBS 223.65]|uniref:RING-type domain-containing protein n=1 Tax=Saprolegnia parasitica (strain CBS 223.65) TaxID=695850 RepID=A0A067C848_SAPPC|nr:hypothetical protein SPRG_10995 [Saprolegnia parasitica CBS 223.65]KDO22681.1 hypothetical protein SPRG_10995 [Saprolegnia parasitica CBS 223.65]|eukprot:XP_012206596.1 hypothetical protein SPRG_10995 [Saprolegnia parasitica CBS 223.65]